MVNLTDESINKLNTNFFCLFFFLKKKKGNKPNNILCKTRNEPLRFCFGWASSGSEQTDENIDITSTELNTSSKQDISAGNLPHKQAFEGKGWGGGLRMADTSGDNLSRERPGRATVEMGNGEGVSGGCHYGSNARSSLPSWAREGG